MKLSEKQAVFTQNVAMLLLWAHRLGFDVTLGECYRTPEQAALNAKRGVGIANSLHIQRLAIDLNLFRGGLYLIRTEEYAALGAFWKSLDPLNRWGGDWKKPDAFHFSMEHEGVQ